MGCNQKQSKHAADQRATNGLPLDDRASLPPVMKPVAISPRAALDFPPFVGQLTDLRAQTSYGDLPLDDAVSPDHAVSHSVQG